MELRVLGPLEVRIRDAAVDLGTPRIRAVCGILLVRPGDLVSAEQLIDELWPDSPPPNARPLIRGYVSRLRRALGEADRVVSRKPGYVLRVEQDELDLHRFERLVTQARQAGDPHRAAELFGQAHRLWRGEPFADVPHTASIAATVTWLTERRLAVAEERFDAALAAGQDAEVITELTAFVAAHPLRERAAGQLMRALYRCGRQSEALARYQETRRTLVEEVGVAPGEELRRLHQRILDADPALSATPVVSAVPRQLPRGLTTFVGRDRALTDLATALDATGPVVVVHGAPGVGKSALAVRAAHAVADRFPDGQLHVHLSGATAGIAPLSPVEALHRMLRALDVLDPPADADEAAGLFRTLVADRRLLLLLDNAASAAQVRPLLPGGHGSAVLVTSRTRLTTLEGATHLRLDPLEPDAARAMLGALVSDVRTAAEPDATRRLAQLCDHLPLGLHVAAARLNARPSWAVRDLVDRLLDQCQRLTELSAGDIALRGSLAVSHAALRDSDHPADRTAARALCLFGVLPVTAVDAGLAAALLDTSGPDTDRIVERLLDAHLVEEATPGRYHMHDLIRLLARELAADTVPADEQHRALTRVLDHCLATVHRVNELAYRHRSHFPIHPAAAPAVPRDAEDALRWLHEWRSDLGSLARQAMHGGNARLGLHLLLALHWHLQTNAGDVDDTIELYGEAVEVAAALGDRAAEAFAHSGLGTSLLLAGRTAEALVQQDAELAIARELGDRFSEQRALGNLGSAYLSLDRPEDAAGYLRQQLELSTAIDEPVGQAFALLVLGKTHHRLGQYDEASRLIEEALGWYEKMGDDLRVCDALELLALVFIDVGEHARAATLAARGLGAARRIGYQLGEICTLTVLARARRLGGDVAGARSCAEQALVLCQNRHDTTAGTEARDEYAQLVTDGA